MKLIKRNPERALSNREFRNSFSDLVSRFFDDDFYSTDLVKTDWNPKVDILEQGSKLIVKADLPGVDEKNLDVQIADGILTISGKKEENQEVKEKDYYRIERSYGSFTRSISLPESVQPDKIKADYKKGVLTIELPKTEESAKKKISVKVS